MFTERQIAEGSLDWVVSTYLAEVNLCSYVCLAFLALFSISILIGFRRRTVVTSENFIIKQLLLAENAHFVLLEITLFLFVEVLV